MLVAPREAHTGLRSSVGTAGGTHGVFLFTILLILICPPQGTAWPYDYRHLYNHCPGPEWNIMCRGCCEYDVIRCKCPLQGTPVGYAVPCCRNAINECDPCIIHPGCSIFENCKRCNNGTWGPRDDFFTSGKYCAECRPGWSGGDCLKCGGVIRKRQGHLVLESYPNNARCEWTLQVDRPFTIEFRFMMLSLEFDHSCHYDYVEVRDGDSINSRVVGRFCGNNRPAPIQSSGNSLHILFVSDGYKNFDGFFATFQQNSACSSSPCLHDGTCVLDTSHTYHCACLAGYTGRTCENVVGCSRPPVPTHGSTEGVFHHSGARITFHCDPEFDLRGIHSAICLPDGTWSAPAPKCVPAERFCTLPPKPMHGDRFLVYGPNDVLIALQYLCYRPYKLSGSSQRTCLPNNTWSGTAPICAKVNNTLGDPDKAKEIDKDSGKDINKTKYQENTTIQGKAHVGAKDLERVHINTTTVDSRGKDLVTSLDKTLEEAMDKVGPEETNTSTEKNKEGNKVSKDVDDSLNTVEANNSQLEKQHEKDARPGEGVIDETRKTVVVIQDKGQKEKQTKEEQVENSSSPDKIGPNDTKLKILPPTHENTVELNNIEMTQNHTDPFNTNDIDSRNRTRVSPEQGNPAVSTGVNVVLYGAGGGTTKMAEERPTLQNRGESTQKTTNANGDLEKEKEQEKETNLSILEKSCPPLPRLYHGYQQLVPGMHSKAVAFFCNHSYALSGEMQRTCQPDGSWSGKQPLCVKACREPKVSELVKQRVLPPQAPFRKTPVHKLYTSVLGRQLQSDSPIKGPTVTSQLPQGFHQLYTHIEYECASPYYHHYGSPRRTCLKTGKWSGRHVSCSPVCGNHLTFDPERPAEAHWPWLAAIYRHSANGAVKKGGGAGAGIRSDAPDWQLVCSGALVNQRSVVVAAHCVTQLGKMYPLDTARLKVVVGKHYRSDLRESKGLQHLRLASIAVHPNYDPLILDSDLAVVKLQDKARIGEQVSPICLPRAQGGKVAITQGLVTGWSPLVDVAAEAEERARVGLVELADVVPCERQYARSGVPVSVTDNMLCASQKPNYGPSNICPSDTGGLLVLPGLSPGHSDLQEQGTGLWRLMGLVSFGYDQGECNPELYTVYTHVANFKDWIESHMK